jgi:hypothetical protein
MNRRILKSAALAFVAAAAACGITGTSARQCVANKGAFVVEVGWYSANALTLIKTSSLDANGIGSRSLPKRIDSIPVGQSSCNDTNEAMIAVVNMPGAMAAVNTPVLPGTRVSGKACGEQCSYPVIDFTPGNAAYPLSSDARGYKPSVLIGLLPTDKYVEVYGTTGDFKWRYGPAIK